MIQKFGHGQAPVQFQGNMVRKTLGMAGAAATAYLLVRHGVHVDPETAATTALGYASVRTATKDTPVESKLDNFETRRGRVIEGAEVKADGLKDKAAQWWANRRKGSNQ